MLTGKHNMEVSHKKKKKKTAYSLIFTAGKMKLRFQGVIIVIDSSLQCFFIIVLFWLLHLQIKIYIYIYAYQGGKQNNNLLEKVEIVKSIINTKAN